ncbi:MAG: hypothetical protein GXW96_09960 [Christensenellaceae bacterium]|nr:hypothetical protein [Christensenellaceae bacterium]
MMRSAAKPFGVFSIAAAYIGTVVGAGFASGQEVLRFFTAHGVWGICGIGVSALLFFFIGYTALLLGRRLSARSHMEVVRHTNGALLGSLIDIVVTVMLFGGLCTMLAGSGAIFAEQFGLPPLLGILAMMAATLVTVLTGTRGVVSAISYLVPFLAAALAYIFLANLLRNPLTPREVETAAALGSATPHWLLSAVNYASYNVVIAVGVAAPSRKTLLGGALLGAGGLMLGMLAINFCLMTNVLEVGMLEVPMAAVAQKISAALRIMFAVVLLSEVYSTAVGNLFGFTQRLSARLPRVAVIVVTSALATLAAQLGFSNMVRFLYPAVGYGGMLFMGGVAYVWIAKRDTLT